MHEYLKILWIEMSTYNADMKNSPDNYFWVTYIGYTKNIYIKIRSMWLYITIYHL